MVEMKCHRFGPFDLDAEAGELRKFGIRIKIQRQPFQILLTLVKKAPLLVSREDLRQAIWASDTYVDFDHSLNAAVNKVRQALGDASDSPRYIETVPGQGYRFVAPVEQPPAEKIENASAPIDWPKRRNAILFAAASAAILIAVYLSFHRAPKLTDKDTIVLADFVNTTGDPVFDGTLRRGLAIQLEQSPFLSLIPEERVQRALHLMGQPADARITPELAREVCERTSSAAVLEGTISSLGSQYVLGLRAKSCRTGDILDDEQVQASKKEDVLRALTQIASKFRTRIGESLISVQRYDTPLAEATTPSLEALKTYSTAYRILSSTGSTAALPYFDRAIQIDPKFAMAHAFLGRIYADVGDSVRSARETRSARTLRDRVSEHEKFFIDASYDLQVTGNFEKAQQTCELWTQVFPRAAGTSTAHGFLTGFTYPVFAKYEKAVEEGKKWIDADPDFAIAYVGLSYNYQSLDRFDEAADSIKRATDRKLEIPEFFVQRYDLAFLKGDRREMERQAALAHGMPSGEDWTLDHEAYVAAYFGQLEKARKLARRAADLAQKSSQLERAALYQTGEALWEAFLGNVPEAKRGAREALKLSKARDVEFGAAFALAYSGDSPLAETLATDLETRFPEDTAVRFTYLPELRALLARNQHDFEKAIDLLQPGPVDELGSPPSTFFAFFGGLYPAYLRGEARLLAHQGVEGAAEFEKILNHPGIVVSQPIGALAHLQLARALQSSGDNAKARSAYEAFLTLWKDADHDIPIFIQARGEYAKLYSGR